MNESTLYYILPMISAALTFIAGGYVLLNLGEVNPGITIIPLLLLLIFMSLYRKSKNKNYGYPPRQ